MGIIIVLVASFFSAVVYILISKIGKRDNSYVIVFYFMLFATCIGGIGSFLVGKHLTYLITFYLFIRNFWFFWTTIYDKAFQNAEAI